MYQEMIEIWKYLFYNVQFLFFVLFSKPISERPKTMGGMAFKLRKIQFVILSHNTMRLGTSWGAQIILARVLNL